MINKFFFIYLSSFIMLFTLNQLKRPYYYSNSKEGPYSSFISHKRIQILSSFKNPQMAELLIAYVTGSKKHLSRKVKKYHKYLNLYHLFTPSGIHLSSLYAFTTPLQYMIKKISLRTLTLFLALIFLFPLFLPKLYSIKRISLLRFINMILKRSSFDPTIFQVFLLTFSIDLLFGTFKDSPLSYTYSFLFLGIILSSIGFPKIVLPITLLGAQLIIAYFQFSPITYLGFAFGFLLTGLFALIFPIIFIYFFLPLNILQIPCEFILQIYWNLIKLCGEISLKSGFIYSSIPIIAIVLILCLKIKIKIKFLAVVILLSIHCNPLCNLPKSRFLMRNYNAINIYYPEAPFKKITRTRGGYKIIGNDNQKCLYRLGNPFYIVRCQPQY